MKNYLPRILKEEKLIEKYFGHSFLKIYVGNSNFINHNFFIILISTIMIRTAVITVVFINTFKIIMIINSYGYYFIVHKLVNIKKTLIIYILLFI